MTNINISEQEIKAYMTLLETVETKMAVAIPLYSMGQKMSQAVAEEQRETTKTNIKKAITEDKVFAKELLTHIKKNKKEK